MEGIGSHVFLLLGIILLYIRILLIVKQLYFEYENHKIHDGLKCITK